jgi:FkbM family methyltransferase
LKTGITTLSDGGDIAATVTLGSAPQMLGRYWWAVVQRLDRPGRRWLLVVPGSIWVSFSYRAPCLVNWRGGVWIHHYRGAKIPHADLGRAAPPSVFTEYARDTALYAYTPQEGDVVFDVGAGTGSETLLFSRLVGPAGRVVSIEAHPRTYRRIVELCSANTLANVTPLQVAAAEDDGTVAITDLSNHVRNTTSVAAQDGLDVPARRLETIAKSLDITHIDFLKMNIEGAEVSALRGLGPLLAKTRHVCIACHDFIADEEGDETLRTKSGVRDLLDWHGFELRTRDDAADPWTRDYVYGVNAHANV